MAEKESEAVVVTETPALEVPTKDFVRYIGPCSTRVIRTNEWPRSIAHSKLPKADLVWDKWNGWFLPKSGLSDEVLKVLSDDGSFAISDK